MYNVVPCSLNLTILYHVLLERTNFDTSIVPCFSGFYEFYIDKAVRKLS